MRHYLQVQETDFERAIECSTVQRFGQKALQQEGEPAELTAQSDTADSPETIVSLGKTQETKEKRGHQRKTDDP